MKTNKTNVQASKQATPKSASIAPIDLADYLSPEQINEFHRQRLVMDLSTEDHFNGIIENGLKEIAERQKLLGMRPEDIEGEAEQFLPIMFPADAARLLTEICEAGGISTIDYVREYWCKEIYWTISDDAGGDGIPDSIDNAWRLSMDDIRAMQEVVHRWKAKDCSGFA